MASPPTDTPPHPHDAVAEQAAIRRHVEELAVALPHRGSNTESERMAADYIRDAMGRILPDTETDPFASTESWNYLLAMYFADFIFVALVAHWLPGAALLYSFVVFLSYLAEAGGYRVFARMLLQYHSQNVVGRLPAREPRFLVVFLAHYDSARATPLLRLAERGLLPVFHGVLVLCMVVVMATCAVDAWMPGGPTGLLLALRWSAAALLFAAATGLYYGERTGAYQRGANGNASGVAALLSLAQRFAASPPEQADIWFVATGSKEGGLNGMRRLIGSHRLDKRTTFFINLDRVGVGDLHYVAGEGALQRTAPTRFMREAAARAAREADVRPLPHLGRPTDAFIACTRGYHAITLTARPGADQRPDLAEADDSIMHLDFGRVGETVDFAENLALEVLGDLEHHPEGVPPKR
jgi:hypothetical protein